MRSLTALPRGYSVLFAVGEDDEGDLRIERQPVVALEVDDDDFLGVITCDPVCGFDALAPGPFVYLRPGDDVDDAEELCVHLTRQKECADAARLERNTHAEVGRR